MKQSAGSLPTLATKTIAHCKLNATQPLRKPIKVKPDNSNMFSRTLVTKRMLDLKTLKPSKSPPQKERFSLCEMASPRMFKPKFKRERSPIPATVSKLAATPTKKVVMLHPALIKLENSQIKNKKTKASVPQLCLDLTQMSPAKPQRSLKIVQHGRTQHQDIQKQANEIYYETKLTTRAFSISTQMDNSNAKDRQDLDLSSRVSSRPPKIELLGQSQLYRQRVFELSPSSAGDKRHSVSPLRDLKSARYLAKSMKGEQQSTTEIDKNQVFIDELQSLIAKNQNLKETLGRSRTVKDFRSTKVTPERIRELESTRVVQPRQKTMMFPGVKL